MPINSTAFTVEKVLTKQWRDNSAGMSGALIADKVLTLNNVSQEGIDYRLISGTDRDWMKLQDISQTGYSEPKEIYSNISKASLDDPERKLLRIGIAPDEAKKVSKNGRLAGQQMLKPIKSAMLKYSYNLQRENTLKTALQNTSVLTNNVTLSGSDQFHLPTSDPLGVFKDARQAMRNASGVEPNYAIMRTDIIDELVIHPQLRRLMVQYEGNSLNTRELTLKELATVLKLDEIIAADARYESAASKGATSSLSYLWGLDITLFHKGNVKQGDFNLDKNLGYHTVYEEPTVYSYIDANDPKKLWIQADGDEIDDLVDVNLAYLIKAAIA